MSQNFLHLLIPLGLSERQARLYLASLELGSQPASVLSRHASLNRITAYNTLQEMVEKGIMTSVRKQRGTEYTAVAPEYLCVEARKSVDAAERALPELRGLRGGTFRKPVVRFFEGVEGIRKVYDDTLTAKTEILNYANSAQLRTFWPTYDDDYVAERVKRGIHLRGIAPDDAWGRRVHGEDRERLREIRLVDAKAFDFGNEVNIYDHKVAICSFARELFGVIIESVEVAKTQRQIFEMAWQFAGLPAEALTEAGRRPQPRVRTVKIAGGKRERAQA